jgi:hypothetical protein
MDMNLLREWVLAEIDYAIAQREEDSEGYRSSAHGERDVAKMLFDKLCAAQQSVQSDGLKTCGICGAVSNNPCPHHAE